MRALAERVEVAMRCDEFQAVVTDIREESRVAGRQRWQLSLDKTEFCEEASAGVLVAQARNGSRLEIPVMGIVTDAGELWHVVEKPLGVGTTVRGRVG
jgi:hypothetical protein